MSGDRTVRSRPLERTPDPSAWVHELYMALTVEAVRVGRVLLHMKVHSDFDYFYSGGAHKRPLVNILKGHKAKMGLMAGFDSGLIATSNRLGWPGDGETGDPKGQRDAGSTKCEVTKYTNTHTRTDTKNHENLQLECRGDVHIQTVELNWTTCN